MGAREEPFAAFVDAYRDRLVGIAALVHLDPERARGLVDTVLARVYAEWPRLDDPYGFALRAVLDPARAGVRPPGDQPAAFELVDVPDGDERPDEAEDIRPELARLTADERQILVLTRYGGLPPAQIATILDREPADVIAQLQKADQRLQDIPRRQSRRRLAPELAAAAQVPDTSTPVDLPRTGRGLVRLRRLRLTGVVVGVAVLATLGVRQALPPTTPTAASAPAASPTASPTPVAPCDVGEARCRVRISAAWRTEMAGVVSEHLDPTGGYFTGHSYSSTDGGQGGGYWDGGEGALALDLYRRGDGATEVYLQIATSREAAVPCGRLTGRPCQLIRFMDGNRFRLTDPFDVAHGLEAQYRPEGTFVITVVARNTTRAARELPVTRADLVTLISDPRLRFPPR